MTTLEARNAFLSLAERHARAEEDHQKIERIIDAACERYKVSREALLGPGRHEPAVTARHIAIYACVRLTAYSGRKIEGIFGRSHNTVGHAYSRVRGFMDAYPKVREDVEDFIQSLS